MKILKCNGCGRELQPGSLKYVVEVKSFADFDGYLEDIEGDVEDGINELLNAMEGMDQQAIEEDVYRERVYLVCKPCRERLSKDPFSKNEEEFDESEEVKGTLH